MYNQLLLSTKSIIGPDTVGILGRSQKQRQYKDDVDNFPDPPKDGMRRILELHKFIFVKTMKIMKEKGKGSKTIKIIITHSWLISAIIG